MKQSRTMKKVTCILLALCILCVVLAAVIAVAAENDTPAAGEPFYMEEGASVRFTDPTGLRFTAGLTAEKYAEIVRDGAYIDGYGVGMLIVPKAYFDDYAAQTEITDYYDYFTNVKGKKIDLPFLAEQLRTNSDGNYEVNGAIVGIKEANFDLEFRAVAYIAKTEDGVTTRTYTGLSDARSIRAVATAAVNSGRETTENENKLVSTYGLAVSEMTALLPDFTEKTVRIAGENPTLQAFADKIRVLTGYRVLAFSGETGEKALTETVATGTVDLMPLYGGNVTFVVGDTEVGTTRAFWGTGLEDELFVTAKPSQYRIYCGGTEYASLDKVPLSALKEDVTVTYVPRIGIIRSSADLGAYLADGTFRVAPNSNVSFTGVFDGSSEIAGNAWVAETNIRSAQMTQWNVYGIGIRLGDGNGLIIGASMRGDNVLKLGVWHGTAGDEITWGGDFADGVGVADVQANFLNREFLNVRVVYADGNYYVYLNDVLFHTFENYLPALGAPTSVGIGARLDSGVKSAVYGNWNYATGNGVRCEYLGVHTDADEDGKCDYCGQTVASSYDVNVTFDTRVPYVKDTSLVTAKVNGTAVEITNGKIAVTTGTTVVFSHPAYMPVTVTAGEDKTLNVSFVRPYVNTDQSTYNESDKTLTTNGGGKIAVLGSVGAKDFVVQIGIDPQNIIAWTTYGIGIQADGEFINFGLSRRNNDYLNATWAWGFVSPSRNDWTGTGLFSNSVKDATAITAALAAKSLDSVTLTFIYHNDTHVLDAYINGILIVNYATGLTTDAADVMLISTDTSTTYLDWNLGVAGSDAYNTLMESVGAHQWDNGTVTTPATCTAEGTMTYTCTVCDETKTEPIMKIDHTDSDGDGKCEGCGTGVVLYDFTFAFNTAVPYSKDTSLIAVTLNGVAVTLTDGKYKAAPGDVFVFSHPAYMPVTVTTGSETAVTVSFIRAKVDTTNATYDEADGSLQMSGTWQRNTLFNAGGKDFTVQIEIDPKNIEKWTLYGIEIRTGSSYYLFGFSRRSDTYDNDAWKWAFVSPSDYDTGVFARCGDFSALVGQLANQSLEHLYLTYIYHNDTHVVDAYVNDTLVISFQTSLTDDVTDVKLACSDGFANPPKFLDWNYGVVGSDAYDAIEATVKKS